MSYGYLRSLSVVVVTAAVVAAAGWVGLRPSVARAEDPAPAASGVLPSASPSPSPTPIPTPSPTPTPTTPPPPPLPYSPQTGVLFNDPTGTPEQQLALLDHLTRSTQSAPPGSTIRIAVYSFSYGPLADALIAAHRRGVNVRLLIDSHATTPEIALLRRALKTDKTKRSFVTSCRYGCMSSKPSFMHTKLYMFSTAGRSKKVSMIASANPAWGGGTQSWNNLYTVVGDLVLYDANLRNFNDMLKDRTNTYYYRTVSSGPYKEYMFPRNGKDRFSDTIYNVLSAVRCTGAAPGYGVNGRTVVRIAAYKWTALRVNVARALTALKKQGCDIQVIYSADTVDKEVAYELFKQAISVRNGRLDRDRDGELDLYIHSKYVLINGAYGSSNNVKAVYTGSPNFSSNSLRQSNETMIRIQLDSVYDAFLRNFSYIRSRWTVGVKRPAAPTVTADRVQERYPDGDYAVEPDDE